MDHRKLALLLVVAGAAACGGSNNPCDGASGTCKSFTAGKTSESEISQAFVTASDGTTLAFSEGTFPFTNTLTLAAAKKITIKGAGLGRTVLDFSTQAAGAEGILALDGTDGLTLQDLTVRETKGNAIKVTGSTGVYFRRVEAKWTDPDKSKHGAYGLYPVSCTNVLIEGSSVSGAADAGIYVGQSRTIVVRDNQAQENVAGIEIENSFDADVTGNKVTGNTGGILVFDLPGLPQKGGHNVRVFKNQIVDNNGANFAAAGGAVALVPAGTGSFVMANHDVEFFQNTVTGNKSAGFAVVSLVLTGIPFSQDQDYNPFPAKVWAHDNTFSNNGTLPDTTRSLGLLLASGLSAYPGAQVPALLWDGILPPGSSGNQICLQRGSSDHSANLHADQIDPNNPSASYPACVKYDADANVDCQLTPLPGVSVPGA